MTIAGTAGCGDDVELVGEERSTGLDRATMPSGTPMSRPTAMTVVACHAIVARHLAPGESERLQQRELAGAGGAPPQ